MWQKATGRVTGIEVVPPELGRPRIDVTVRISGLFRDAQSRQPARPGSGMVADLSRRKTIIWQAVVAEIGPRSPKASTPNLPGGSTGCLATSRAPTGPGSATSRREELEGRQRPGRGLCGGGYAYGRKTYGVSVPDVFKKRLSLLDATVKNADSREFDMLDSDDFYSYHGGMIAAVRAFKGEAPRAYAGDSSDPDRVKIRSTEEEAKHIFRARILNLRIESMKRHGYKGAGDLSRMVDYVFGWERLRR